MVIIDIYRHYTILLETRLGEEDKRILNTAEYQVNHRQVGTKKEIDC